MIPNSDKTVHIFNQNSSSVWSVLHDVIDSYLQEEPFFVFDIGELVNSFNVWKQLFPRVEPFYAVKCNDSPIVLEILSLLGTGFDCASKGEIKKIMSLGVEPEKLIFANPAKLSSHIQYAASVQVSKMTFDNESELYKIKKFYPNSDLVIRIRSDDENALCQLGIKFGCDPVTEAPHLLKLAQKLDLNVIGVSFHVGSDCRNPQAFRKALLACKSIFSIAKRFGFELKFLDIGGGFPGGKTALITEIAKIVNKTLEEEFADESLQIIAEPGRYFVTSAYTLACQIYSKKELGSNESRMNRNHIMYYINDGVYGSFNCILFDHRKITPIIFDQKYHCHSNLVDSSIWGPTCDGLDRVVDHILMPQLKVGDWLIFENMGAYTLTSSSEFNGFPAPKILTIVNDSVWDFLNNLLKFDKNRFVVENGLNFKLDVDSGHSSDDNNILVEETF
uniref:ornithine decarboxylase n=1 Tax=Cuerna arida TaxID=1464854 RepID=A0A1B6GPX0_9HEMI